MLLMQFIWSLCWEWTVSNFQLLLVFEEVIDEEPEANIEFQQESDAQPEQSVQANKRKRSRLGDVDILDYCNNNRTKVTKFAFVKYNSYV